LKVFHGGFQALVHVISASVVIVRPAGRTETEQKLEFASLATAIADRPMADGATLSI
jgi:hypothetical protein